MQYSSIYPIQKWENQTRTYKRKRRLYIDMRCSKGYSDELEKLIHNGGGVILTVELKKAATKNMRLTVIAYSQAEKKLP